MQQFFPKEHGNKTHVAFFFFTLFFILSCYLFALASGVEVSAAFCFLCSQFNWLVLHLDEDFSLSPNIKSGSPRGRPELENITSRAARDEGGKLTKNI